MAGLTANYFKGISSGLTLKWVYQVWELYADSIFLSMWLALACLICTLLIGLPAAYGLARHPGWLSRLLEEFISLPLACAVHVALHGAFDPGCSCRNGFENA
jgi:putative spermidine/putrescine transport system permease protein